MKKIVLICIALQIATAFGFTQAPTPKEGTILIASWNIRDFSDHSRNDTELAQICGVLCLFDLVAIQEVLDTTVLDRAVTILKDQYGLDYAYLDSPKSGTSAATAEIYAFLYRKDSVVSIGMGSVVSQAMATLTREPFYALFKAGNFDFYIVDTHLLSAKKDAEREAVQIARAYRAIQALDAEDDVILLGDFNLTPRDPAFADLKSIPSMTCVDESVPTTIRDHLDDNLWFEAGFTREYTGDFGIYKFDEDLFANDDKAASLAVSDHRPVWARFSTQVEDTSHQQ